MLEKKNLIVDGIDHEFTYDSNRDILIARWTANDETFAEWTGNYFRIPETEEEALEAFQNEFWSSYMEDMPGSAAALYDGGWRASDRDQLMTEYDMTEQEANEISAQLARIEEENAV